MKKILVTGANGQLGNEIRLLEAANKEFGFVFTDVAELDICNAEAVDSFVEGNSIDIIINCAAYTAVDKAEDDKDLCNRINAEAPANLASAAAKHGAKLVHVSTDYVFDGTAHTPYNEQCAPCPASVYGRTKLAGEDNIRKILPSAIIIRTAWLYSTFGNNFVKTMIRLGKEKNALNVVYDQIGSPTYAADLAAAIMQICDRLASDENPDKFGGTYHFTDEGVCSWYDFTIEIHKNAGISSCKVSPILSGQYPAKAPRPHYSVLDKAKIKDTFGIEIPHWTVSLQHCIAKLGQ